MYTITDVKHYDKDKDGNQLKTKTGKPYTRCVIKVKEHGDQWVSLFGSAETLKWAPGSLVDIEITQNDRFLNGRLKKATDGLVERVASLEKDVAELKAAKQFTADSQIPF